MNIKHVRQRYIYQAFYFILAIVFMIFLLLNVIHVNNNIYVHGVLKSKKVIYINSPCYTFLEEIFVAPGEIVKKGHLIAKLDKISVNTYLQQLREEKLTTEREYGQVLIQEKIYDHKLEIMKQEIIETKAQLENAEYVYNANKKLSAISGISTLDLRQSQARVVTLETNLIKLQENLEIYRVQNEPSSDDGNSQNELSLLDSKIKIIEDKLTSLELQMVIDPDDENFGSLIAPTDGIISGILQNRNKGGLIGKISKDDTIAEIIKPDDLFIDSSVSEKDFPYIYVGDNVFITFPAYPSKDYGGFIGVVDELYQETTNINGVNSYKCEIKILDLNQNQLIKPYLGLSTQTSINVRRTFNLLKYMNYRIFDKS